MRQLTVAAQHVAEADPWLVCELPRRVLHRSSEVVADIFRRSQGLLSSFVGLTTYRCGLTRGSPRHAMEFIPDAAAVGLARSPSANSNLPRWKAGYSGASEPPACPRQPSRTPLGLQTPDLLRETLDLLPLPPQASARKPRAAACRPTGGPHRVGSPPPLAMPCEYHSPPAAL